ILPSVQPVANAISRTHECNLIDQSIGHSGYRLRLAAGEESILDPNCRRLVPQALCSVIVEILVAGAHAADIERVERHRSHRRHGGRAGGHLHYRSAYLDPRRPRQHPRCGSDGASALIVLQFSPNMSERADIVTQWIFALCSVSSAVQVGPLEADR